MTLTKKHFQRLWYPHPGETNTIPSRGEYSMTKAEFDALMPEEFWREVVDRVAAEAPDTLLLAEAFWLLEGYFVRTLGMHRVYNSAFMHMLRDEKNLEYRLVIKNTIEFDPEVLKRYVNFMNNPDERTAVDQFGKGDKYFGVCTVLVDAARSCRCSGMGKSKALPNATAWNFTARCWTRRPTRGYSNATPAKFSRCKNGHAKRPSSAAPARHPTLSRPQVSKAMAILIALMFSKFTYLASFTSYYTFYLMNKFDLSTKNAQIYQFVFFAAVATGTIAGGPLGDRLGRKLVIWVSILGVLPFALLLPHVGLMATIVLSVVIGFLIASAFPAIVVYGQELMPGRVGMVSGLFFGFAFGIGGIGAAALGTLADWQGIRFVFLLCSFLPAIGILAGVSAEPAGAQNGLRPVEGGALFPSSVGRQPFLCLR